MTKSSTIIFILFFAILFGLEKKVILFFSIQRMKQTTQRYFWKTNIYSNFFIFVAELDVNANSCINIDRFVHVYL